MQKQNRFRKNVCRSEISWTWARKDLCFDGLLTRLEQLKKDSDDILITVPNDSYSKVIGLELTFLQLLDTLQLCYFVISPSEV